MARTLMTLVAFMSLFTAATAASAANSPMYGGSGGTLVSDVCSVPFGLLNRPAALKGMEVRTGDVVDAVKPMCATLAAKTWMGGTGGTYDQVRCPAGMVVKGIRGRSGALLDKIGLVCADADAIDNRKLWYDTYANGGHGGSVFEWTCPANEVVTGLSVRKGTYVTALGATCTSINNTLINARAYTGPGLFDQETAPVILTVDESFIPSSALGTLQNGIDSIAYTDGGYVTEFDRAVSVDGTGAFAIGVTPARRGTETFFTWNAVTNSPKTHPAGDYNYFWTSVVPTTTATRLRTGGFTDSSLVAELRVNEFYLEPTVEQQLRDNRGMLEAQIDGARGVSRPSLESADAELNADGSLEIDLSFDVRFDCVLYYDNCEVDVDANAHSLDYNGGNISMDMDMDWELGGTACCDTADFFADVFGMKDTINETIDLQKLGLEGIVAQIKTALNNRALLFETRTHEVLGKFRDLIIEIHAN